MKPRQPFEREVRRSRHFSAWIKVQGRVHCECKVMDISKNGAKIVAEEKVPDRFQLTFFQGDQIRVCEVVWRRVNVMGVKFIF
jgi:hypothetical protein